MTDLAGQTVGTPKGLPSNDDPSPDAAADGQVGDWVTSRASSLHRLPQGGCCRVVLEEDWHSQSISQQWTQGDFDPLPVVKIEENAGLRVERSWRNAGDDERHESAIEVRDCRNEHVEQLRRFMRSGESHKAVRNEMTRFVCKSH